MKLTQLLSSLCIALLMQSCSSGKTDETQSEAVTEESTTEKMADKAAASGCCFTKNEDFAPFFPAGNKLLTIFGKEEIAASFYCGADDDPKKSNASRKYQIDKEGTSDPMKAKYITLKIMDYCSRPSDLAAEIERRSTNAEKGAKANPDKVTVARIEKAGLYTGYTWMDASKGNNASNVELFAAVDGRFMIHIQGIDHNRMDALNQLFEMIPLEQLATL